MGGRFLRRSVAIALAFAMHCNAYMYWVDPNCYQKPKFRESLDEAIQMAKRSSQQLASPSDTDYAAVFKRIFKVDRTDSTLFRKYDNINPAFYNLDQNAYNFVQGVLGDIGSSWREESGDAARIASDIRFYCDNDARWQPYLGNTNVMLDHDNLMKMPAAEIVCTNQPEAMGVTYTMRVPLPENDSRYPPHNKQRTTITICDYALNSPSSRGVQSTLGEFRLEADFSTFLISQFDHFISMTILHEWTHSEVYRIMDVGPNPYGWSDIMEKDAEDSLNNADNYAYFGLWALLADRSYSLKRLGLGPQDEQEDAEREADAGYLELYRDHTRRSINLVKKYFEA